MSKALLIKAAETLENLPETLVKGDRFRMNLWGEKDGCGTTACAAGWLLIRGALPGFEAVYEDDELRAKRSQCTGAGTTNPGEAATLALGLNEDESQVWFWYDSNFPENTKPADIAAVLRQYAEKREG